MLSGEPDKTFGKQREKQRKVVYFIDTRRRFYEHEISITVYPAFQLEKDSDSDAKNSVRFQNLNV
jgi:hypothetical protein